MRTPMATPEPIGPRQTVRRSRVHGGRESALGPSTQAAPESCRSRKRPMPETGQHHPDAIFEATLAGVPRSEADFEQLLTDRAAEWEWLYFAGALVRSRDAVEFKWYDHQIGIGALGGSEPDELSVASYLSVRSIKAILERLNRLLQPDVLEQVFGGSDSSGDPKRIEHLAQRIVDCYEYLLDWAARIRGARVPDAFEDVFAEAGHLADVHLEHIRRFIDDAVRRGDEIPALIAAGMPVPRELPRIFGASDDLMHQRFRAAVQVMVSDYSERLTSE